MDSATLIRRVLLTLSVLCGITTLVTLVLVLMNVMGWLGAAILALGFQSAAVAELGGVIMAMFSVGSFVLSGPIALCSVILHTVGGVAALGATRFGARRFGFALVGFHALTFLLGLGVLLFWTLPLLTSA